MYTCIVADDEAPCLEALVEYAEKAPGIKLIGSFSRSIDALAALQSDPAPDIAFLDISMADLTGLQLAKLVAGRTKVIMVTAHRKYAVESYALGVTDYLLKPLSLEAFLSSVQKVSRLLDLEAMLHRNKEFIFVSTGLKGNMVKVFLDDIIYIEGMKNYITIYMGTSKQMSYLGITEIQERLPANRFLRIHKSYIVNSDKIVAIKGNMLKIKDYNPVPIGNIYKDAFFKSIAGSILLSKR